MMRASRYVTFFLMGFIGLIWLAGCTAPPSESLVEPTATPPSITSTTEEATVIPVTAAPTAEIVLTNTAVPQATATATAAPTPTLPSPSTPLSCPGCGPIWLVNWASDETLLLGGAAGIWIQPLSGGEPRLLANPRTTRNIEMAVSADGRYLAALSCGDLTGTSCAGWHITIWQVADGEEIARYEAGITGETQLAFGGQTPDLLAFSVEAEIRLWQIEQNEIVEILTTDDSIRELVFSTDESKFGVIRQNLLSPGSIIEMIWREGGLREPYGTVQWAFAFDPTVSIGAISRWSLEGTETVTLDYIAVTEGFRGGRVQWLQPQPNVMAFAADGRWLAGGDYGVLDIWDVYNHTTILSLPDAHEGRIESLAFSPDQSQIVTLSGEEVKVWSLPDGELARVFHYTAVPAPELYPTRRQSDTATERKNVSLCPLAVYPYLA